MKHPAVDTVAHSWLPIETTRDGRVLCIRLARSLVSCAGKEQLVVHAASESFGDCGLGNFCSQPVCERIHHRQVPSRLR